MIQEDSLESNKTQGASTSSPSLSSPSHELKQTNKREGKNIPRQLASNDALHKWLDSNDPVARREYFEAVLPKLKCDTIPALILVKLQEQSPPPDLANSWDFSHIYEPYIQRRQFQDTDVEAWVWIFSGNTPDEIADRFYSSKSWKPIALLKQLLQWDPIRIGRLQQAFVHVWDSIPEAQLHEPNQLPLQESREQRHEMLAFSGTEGDIRFSTIVDRLLYHARKVWPASVVTAAHLVIRYMTFILVQLSCDPKNLDKQNHRRLSQLYNSYLSRLGLPASIEPFNSMRHNWQAQRVLLEYGENFEPPLKISERSYRAIASVLAASKKTARETKATLRRSREWPPWRIDQDGMDAQRDSRQDLSRVSLALIEKRASGYPDNSQDSALRILGGQELDGTPTIHTRSLVKSRAHPKGLKSAKSVSDPLHPVEWTARIQATRDVQEAWSAFVAYQNRGGKPTVTMYYAMFIKLASEARREATNAQDAPPGQGREVLPVADDTFSVSYRASRQPPTLRALYSQMLSSGVRPNMRCTTFLVERAFSIEEGLRVIVDSKILDEHQIAWLAGHSNASWHPPSLGAVPDQILTAFIKLLGRFTPRRARIESKNADSKFEIAHQTEPKEDGEEGEESSASMKILELRHSTITNPLWHAAELLKQRQPNYRPAWYMLFRALSREGVVVSRELAGDPLNSILAWRVLAMALNDFHNRGLELDPQGFIYICYGLSGAIPAFKSNPKFAREMSTAVSSLRHKFTNISSTTDLAIPLPKFRHEVSAVHLHAYIRVLAAYGDISAMLETLQWILNNHEVLHRSGEDRTRKVFVTLAYFLAGTKQLKEVRSQVERVFPNAWPTVGEIKALGVRNEASHWSVPALTKSSSSS
ncbi:hypothetical protein BJ875DRAFT_234873 [Amylocarpus encephaloides]|uniref:Uncharacterized protein n=1 Tax=Amylocarpus encephaloides TaxID=45428 RepID=A0A9P8BZG4_9HELO|nr:hypothetical protein BJ875DRAFT_234873 [Amylocarpus encephaloides]